MLKIDNPQESLLAFAMFGLDRPIPEWVMPGPGTPVHLAPGWKHSPGSDELDFPEWDGEKDDLPYKDNSVGSIFAANFLEHLTPEGLLRVLAEAARVLKDGCPFNILVPHGWSYNYAQDIDHRTVIVLETWRHILDNKYYQKGLMNAIPFRIGLNITIAVKEENTAVVTQLIRIDRS